MRPTDLILVTDPGHGPRTGWPAYLESLAAAGVTLVQIRDKNADGRALVELARAVKQRLEPLGVPVVVNDRLDVAWAAGADGVHLGQSDLDPVDARRWLGPDAIIGLSVDAVAQLDTDSARASSYVAASPVHATPTKSDAGAPLGLDGVRWLRRAWGGLLVGIGGLHERNVAEAIHAGLDGVAVVSAILGSPDPIRATRDLRAAIDAARERS